MNNPVTCQDCIIRSQSFFSRLCMSDIQKLNENKRMTLYKKGQIIFHEGRMPTGIYCLNTGKAKIYKLGFDGKEQIVRFALPGGLIGIRALLGGRQYSASAKALEDSQVCFIDKTTFFRFTLKYSELSHDLMTTLSFLLEEAENKLTSLAQKPVRERLAETLLILNKIFKPDNGKKPEQDAIISLSREDLANIVGTATETVIRLLSEFKDQKLVEVNGRKIKLLDIEGLTRMGKVYE